MTTIPVAHVVTPFGVRSPASVELRGDLIGAVRPTAERVQPWTLVPGLVDIQVNGIGDVDVWTADEADWAAFDAALTTQGVTAWLPTLTSGALDAYPPRLSTIAAMASRKDDDLPTVLGAHLEGPFLGDRPGAHPTERIVDVDSGWLESLGDVVRLVTLGPERPGAIEAIAALSERGVVVGIGHTEADAATVTAAVDAGAAIVTHLYNAMAPFHHRAPGPVGVALTDSRIAASLIADGVHVDPVAIRLAFAAKGPGRVILVSDQVACTGGSDGAVRRPDGTLAGATASLVDGLRTAVGDCGVPLEIAVEAAATTPAALLGERNRGRIESGARADLVALDDDLRIAAVWIGGRLVHAA